MSQANFSFCRFDVTYAGIHVRSLWSENGGDGRYFRGPLGISAIGFGYEYLLFFPTVNVHKLILKVELREMSKSKIFVIGHVHFLANWVLQTGIIASSLRKKSVRKLIYLSIKHIVSKMCHMLCCVLGIK